MWNMLLVMIVAAVIWFFGASSFNVNQSSLKSPITQMNNSETTNVDNSTETSNLKIPTTNTNNSKRAPRSVVDSLTAGTVQRVNDAREQQQQEQDAAINN